MSLEARVDSVAIDWSVFYARLHAFVAARVRRGSDTDDLVHLILERAIERSSGTTIESAPGWLFGIARNAIADHYRAQARLLSSEADALEAEAPLGSSDEERNAVIGCMEPLLRALPAETSQLLRWADMEGRSMQAIADQLGITLTAAKSRVQRARKDFIKTTRQCCSITIDARGRVTDLVPRQQSAATVCEPCTPGCSTSSKERV
jgi:RNA polymerase sigma-70 factor (ECF subfamily)